MRSKSIEKIFLDAFYGDYKRHGSVSKLVSGKLMINSLCGTPNSKFLTWREDITCKKCLSRIKKCTA